MEEAADDENNSFMRDCFVNTAVLLTSVSNNIDPDPVLLDGHDFRTDFKSHRIWFDEYLEVGGSCYRISTVQGADVHQKWTEDPNYVRAKASPAQKRRKRSNNGKFQP